jgi:hypothetical protein
MSLWWEKPSRIALGSSDETARPGAQQDISVWMRNFARWSSPDKLVVVTSTTTLWNQDYKYSSLAFFLDTLSLSLTHTPLTKHHVILRKPSKISCDTLKEDKFRKKIKKMCHKSQNKNGCMVYHKHDRTITFWCNLTGFNCLFVQVKRPGLHISLSAKSAI